MNRGRVSPAEARAQLLALANHVGYSHRTKDMLINQLLDAWLRYNLRPTILPNPQPVQAAATAVPPPPQQIICMMGNLMITVNARSYPIPLRVYVLMPCPLVSPLVQVSTYAGAVVPRNHPFVNSRTGYVDLSSPNLPPGIWRPGDHSIPQILLRLQTGFGVRPPLVEDPELVEKRTKSEQLTRMVQTRLMQETQKGQAEYAAAAQQLRELRRRNAQLVAERDRLAAREGSGVSRELASTREELLSVEALLREYGVVVVDSASLLMSSGGRGLTSSLSASGGTDIKLEELLMISSGHPLRDQLDDLRVEEMAMVDALAAGDEAFQRQQVSLDEYLPKTRELARQQCEIKTRLIKLGREMDAAVEADAKREALEAARSGMSGGGVGGGGGDGGGGYPDRATGGPTGAAWAAGAGGNAARGAAMSGLMRSQSKLVTSGILPVTAMPMHRGGSRAVAAAPPPPGPPTLGETRGELRSYAS